MVRYDIPKFLIIPYTIPKNISIKNHTDTVPKFLHIEISVYRNSGMIQIAYRLTENFQYIKISVWYIVYTEFLTLFLLFYNYFINYHIIFKFININSVFRYISKCWNFHNSYQYSTKKRASVLYRTKIFLMIKSIYQKFWYFSHPVRTFISNIKTIFL